MSYTLTVTVIGLVADTLECIIQHRERMMLVVREMYDGIVAYNPAYPTISAPH